MKKDKIIKSLINIFKIFPMKNYILMESSPDFTDNTKALFDVFIEKNVNNKYKIIWFVNDKKEFNKVKIKNVKFIDAYSNKPIKKIIKEYYLYSAKMIIDSNRYINKVRKEQFRLHLGHGMPIKDVTTYYRQSGEFDFLLQLSKNFTDTICKAYNIESNKTISLGHCRNDDLLKYANKDIIKIEEWKNKKIIVWLPTYRKHQNKKTNIDTGIDYPYGIPCLKTKEDFENINILMKNYNILLLIKLHPAQDKSQLNKFNLSNLKFITDDILKEANITLYQLLSKTEALITDYSSVYYDYLITKKPIGLAIDDLDNYIDKIGIVYDNYYDAIKGKYIYDYKDLENFIISIGTNNDEEIEKRMWALNRYHDYKDDQSSLRVYEFIKPYLK